MLPRVCVSRELEAEAETQSQAVWPETGIPRGVFTVAQGPLWLCVLEDHGSRPAPPCSLWSSQGLKRKEQDRTHVSQNLARTRCSPTHPPSVLSVRAEPWVGLGTGVSAAALTLLFLFCFFLLGKSWNCRASP